MNPNLQRKPRASNKTNCFVYDLPDQSTLIIQPSTKIIFTMFRALSVFLVAYTTCVGILLAAPAERSTNQLSTDQSKIQKLYNEILTHCRGDSYSTDSPESSSAELNDSCGDYRTVINMVTKFSDDVLTSQNINPRAMCNFGTTTPSQDDSTECYSRQMDVNHSLEIFKLYIAHNHAAESVKDSKAIDAMNVLSGKIRDLSCSLFCYNRFLHETDLEQKNNLFNLPDLSDNVTLLLTYQCNNMEKLKKQMKKLEEYLNYTRSC